MRRLVLPAAAALMTTIATAMFAVSPSYAASPLTFDGQCQFTGTSVFSSSVTLVPSPIRNSVTASGTCSGTLSGTQGTTTTLSNAPVQYQATEFSTRESCEADPNASGKGALVFQEGSLRFTVVENRVGGQADLAYTGDNGGSASGVAYVNSSDPAGILEQCASGGISSSPVSIVFQTTPAISG